MCTFNGGYVCVFGPNFRGLEAREEGEVADFSVGESQDMRFLRIRLHKPNFHFNFKK